MKNDTNIKLNTAENGAHIRNCNALILIFHLVLIKYEKYIKSDSKTFRIISVDFLSEKSKEYEKISIEKFEEEIEEKVEKRKETREELLADAENYVATKPGYEKKLKELKERHDSETQKTIIKKIEDYSCQIDGFSIEYITKEGKKRKYVEAAHIIPKYKGGDESIKNIIILCPNCHKKLDKNVITIDIEKKELKENEKLITFHHDNHLFV